MSLLEIEGLSVRIGELEVLRGLDLAVGEREAVGLFGPNGSGKSTLLNALSGLVPALAGRVRLAGRDLRAAATHEIARAGIARTFQTPRLFHRMTVTDNLRPASGRLDEAGLERLLDAAGLSRRRHDLAADLGLFEIKRLEIARAAAMAPRLVLLDEPTGGLTPAEAAGIVALIRTIVLPAAAAIIVEHRLDVLRELATRAIVLDQGSIIADGTFAAVEKDERVRAAYFGSTARQGGN